jgi:hypothetical protein
MENQPVEVSAIAESEEVPARPHGDVAVELQVQIPARRLKLNKAFLAQLVMHEWFRLRIIEGRKG